MEFGGLEAPQFSARSAPHTWRAAQARRRRRVRSTRKSPERADRPLQRSVAARERLAARTASQGHGWSRLVTPRCDSDEGGNRQRRLVTRSLRQEGSCQLRCECAGHGSRTATVSESLRARPGTRDSDLTDSEGDMTWMANSRNSDACRAGHSKTLSWSCLAVTAAVILDVCHWQRDGLGNALASDDH